MRFVRWVICTCFILCTVACSERPVAEDLNQSQANEVVAFLHDSGIAAIAERGTGARSRYRVEVPSSAYGDAVSLLQRQGLPSEARASFSEMTESGGILPPSREIEALRADRALALELVEMLENHPSIAQARAVVRSHTSNNQLSSVSVVVQKRPAATLVDEEVKNLIQASIPEVLTENIQISTHEARKVAPAHSVTLVPLLMWRVPEKDYVGLVLAIVGCLCAIGIVGSIVGYWIGVSQHPKVFRENEPTEPVSRAIRYERRKALPETNGT